MQQRRDPDHEFRIQVTTALFSAEPQQIEIQGPHLDVGEHVDRMRETGRYPDRAIGRHQPAALRRRHLHGALGGIDQLRLAMHMGVEPHALSVVVRDQMDAVAGRDAAPDDGGNWLLGDIHWRHLVRTTPYNLFQKIAGFDQGPDHEQP